MQDQNSRHRSAGKAHEPVRGAYTMPEVISTIKALRDCKKSFRQIAKEDYGGLITHASIQRVLSGQEPHDPKIRAALGLPAKMATVYLIGDGEIPPRAQVIAGNFGVCACGMPFYKNHPVRKHCFICSPYKKLIK